MSQLPPKSGDPVIVTDLPKYAGSALVDVGVVGSSMLSIDTDNIFADLPFLGAGPALKCISCGGYVFKVNRVNEPYVYDSQGGCHRKMTVSKIETCINGLTTSRYSVDAQDVSYFPSEIYHPLVGIVHVGEMVTFNCTNCSSSYNITVSSEGNLTIWGSICKSDVRPASFNINYSDSEGNTHNCNPKPNEEAIRQFVLKAAEDKRQKINEALSKAASNAVEGAIPKLVEQAVGRQLQSIFGLVVERVVKQVKQELAPKPEPDAGKNILK